MKSLISHKAIYVVVVFYLNLPLPLPRHSISLERHSISKLNGLVTYVFPPLRLCCICIVLTKSVWYRR